MAARMGLVGGRRGGAIGRTVGGDGGRLGFWGAVVGGGGVGR